MAGSRFGCRSGSRPQRLAALRRPMPAGCLATEIDFAITLRNQIVARGETSLLNPHAANKSRGDFMSNVRVLATDLEFPEGPVVMPDGSVVLVEIRGQRLTRVWPDGRKEGIAKIPGGPHGAALGPDGKMYVCNNSGFSWIPTRNMIMPGPQPDDYRGGSIQRVDLQSGKVETVVDKCGEHGLRGPNDLVFDKHGGLWFSDLGKRRARDMDVGAFYYIKPGIKE